MKVKFAVVLAIIVAMLGLIGLASAAETTPDKQETKAAGDAQEKAVKELQGDWRVLRGERDGRRENETHLSPAAGLVVKGDEIEAGGSVFKLRLDPGKTPAEIDMTVVEGPDEAKTIAGIYSLSEGRLTVCLPDRSNPSAPRPKELKTKPNDRLELTIMERVADAALRKWLDKRQEHETVAKYLSQSADGVRLEKTDGKIVTVPLDKLSDMDRQYVAVKRFLEEDEKLKRDPNSPVAKAEAARKKAFESLAKANVELGVALMKRGDADEAIQHFRKALEIRPDSAEAHNGMGSALLKNGRIDEAIQHFRMALQIKPDYAEAKENLEKAEKAAQARK
jgi:uncharacterized protein (TIGR03067 family)